MRLGWRRAVPLLAPLALAGPPAVRANVTGNLELQSQTTQNVGQPGAGTNQSTLLMESLTLHYAGLPFGPAVAVATAGGGVSNVTGWGRGAAAVHGRVYTFDASLGLLPRRAVPLRLYASGAVEDGTTGALASRGAGPSLLYGGAVNVEPGRFLPGLRLDASESRTSRPGHDAMSDVQRRLVASGYGSVAGQRVNLSAQVDEDHRDAAGDAWNRAATLSLGSPRHQTTFLATQARRSLAVLATLPPTVPPALPPPTGITTEQTLSASSDQRWSPVLSTQLGGRVADAGADDATGRVADLRGGATWVPLRGVHQVTLSASGSSGYTRTRRTAGSLTDPADPLREEVVSGRSYGGGARAGYARVLGPLNAGVSAGGAVNGCDCGGFGNEGTTRQLDGTASLALTPVGRASGQLDYTVTGALAPLPRGGDRLEHHARATGRLAVGAASAVSAGLTWDDGFRELFDITTGRAVGLHERAVGGSLGLSTQLGRAALSAEVRHSRGTVVSDGTPFVAGGAAQVRSQTSAHASASWSVRAGLSFQAQVLGTRADITRGRGSTSAGGNAALVWRLGRLAASAQYQGAHVRLDGQPATLQQSVRVLLSRPFELWR